VNDNPYLVPGNTVCLICGAVVPSTEAYGCPICGCHWWDDIEPSRRFGVLLEKLTEIINSTSSRQEALEVFAKICIFSIEGKYCLVWQVHSSDRSDLRYFYPNNIRGSRLASISSKIIYPYLHKVGELNYLQAAVADNPIRRDIIYQSWGAQSTWLLAVIQNRNSINHLRGCSRMLRKLVSSITVCRWFSVS
jgi:hypothetical protein